MTVQGAVVTISLIVLANLGTAAEPVGLDRPVTFHQIASEEHIKLDYLAEKMNLDAKEIRFKRPQDVGLTVAEVENAVEAIKEEQAEANKNRITTLVTVLLVGVIGISVLASVAVLLLRLRFGNRVQTGDW